MKDRYLMQDDKDLWIANFRRTYQECHQGTNGRCQDDLDFLAAHVHAVIDRVPRAESGISHFEPDTDRGAFLAKLYERVRHELLVRHRISTNVIIFDKVIWALIQVAHVDQINLWDRQLNDMDTVPGLFTDAEEIKSRMALHFKIFFPIRMTAMEKGDMLKTSGGVKVVLKMDKDVRKKCLRRDASRCVITGEDYPEVCHFLPIRGGDSDKTSTFRWALMCIYGSDRGKALAKKLFDHGMINTLANTMCLSPSFRARWGRAEFALKFLGTGQDHKSRRYFMRLGFYWMKKVTPIEAVYRQTAHDLLAGMMPLPRSTRAVNVLTNTRIIDGDVVTIWADSEDELPDGDIVNCQWDIIRMASLCDGAEPGKNGAAPVREDLELSDEDMEDFEEVDDTDTASDMF
ncbi:hypothetical protein F5X68DRAFT_272106 [Plectosphaerella plurivora]|uniref:HNH nuclease domain-containing protein n=1 Tax=Plectosphaerella plurivora TaxID=936078 RepID=A0A9P8VM87_9PEZI|nr:hypothetical protein F5X68DRAFT_272106 [Plectosphaerella plurivora]